MRRSSFLIRVSLSMYLPALASSSPSSMHLSCQFIHIQVLMLELDRLFVICHAEGESWPMAEGIEAVPAAMLASADWQPLMA